MTVRSLLCKRSLHVRIFLREGVCVSSVCVRRETGRRGAAPAAGAARALGSASGLSRGVSGARLNTSAYFTATPRPRRRGQLSRALVSGSCVCKNRVAGGFFM